MKKLAFLVAFLLVGVASAAPSVVSTTQTSATIEGLECGSKYRFEIRKYAANGELSSSADAVEAETKSCADTQPPTLPPGLTMTGATDSTITIAWAASTDNVGVAGYRLYRDGVAVATTTQTTYRFTGLACETSYSLAYEAFDAAGNTTHRNEATTLRSTTSCLVPAPSNTAPPAISGTVQVGRLLSASQGSWTGSPTSYAFQWLRCDSAGASCGGVSGAASSTYTLTSADEGKTMRVTVTATNSGGSTSATSAQTATVAAATTTCALGQFKTDFFNNMLLGAPHALSRCDATVDFTWSTGSPGSGVNVDRFSARLVGQIRFASTGAYTFSVTADDGVRLFVDGVLVINKWIDQPATTYTASRELTAGTHEVKLEYYENGGAAVLKLAMAAPTPPTPPTNTSLPTISGVAQVGSALSASPGGWAGNPTPTLGYQWHRCDTAGANCGPIANAIGTSYTLAAADEGRTLRVELTATNSAGSATAVSSPTAVVQAAPAAPSPGTGLANLWVHPQQSGSCTRSAVPGAYNAATACASFAAAYTAANQTAEGSVVLIKGGAYTTGLTLTGARSSTNRITLAAAPAETVTFSGSRLQVGDGSTSTAPSNVTIKGVVGAQFGGGTCSDCRYGVHVKQGTHHIRIESTNVGMVQIWGARDIDVVGNTLGPCRARTVSTSSTTQNEDGCSFNKIDWFGLRPTRITYENNLLHGYDMSASCFSVANGGTNTAGQPDCHWRAFWCIGCDGLTFRGNVIRDSKEGPALANTGPEAAAVGTRNVLIENNYFGPGINHGPGMGTWGGRNYGNNGGFEVGWCSTYAGVRGHENVTYRFNSHYRNSGIWFHQAGAGNLCDDSELANIYVYGNVGARSACRAPVVYRNNVYANTGTCNASETNIGASGTIPFYRADIPVPAWDSYELVGGLSTADNFVPANVFTGCPATDRLGKVRGIGGYCDAGAYER